MTAYLELVGPAGSGKTTLTELATRQLPGFSILLIDASPNQHLTPKLTRHHLVDPPLHTLQSVLSTLLAPNGNGTPLPPKNEAIDWAFHDLSVTLGEEIDLIAAGPDLSGDLPEAAQKALTYGLGRLAAEYDLVLVDGYHPAIHAVWPAEALQLIVVSLPDITDSPMPTGLSLVKTPGLIVNRFPGGALSPVLEWLVQEHSLLMIGKLPHYKENEREDALPEAFKNCLLRLDIPLQAI